MGHQFKLIVISSSAGLPDEVNAVIQLFEAGLQYFHFRKPEWGAHQSEEFLRSIPDIYHPHIVIHSNFQLTNIFNLKGIHLNEGNKKDAELFKKYKVVSGAFHSLPEIEENFVPYQYVFLSPIFDSISKPGLKAAFNLEKLQSGINLQQQKNAPPEIIALGGINAGNIQSVKQLGFSGAAVVGAVWNEPVPVKAFTALRNCILV